MLPVFNGSQITNLFNNYLIMSVLSNSIALCISEYAFKSSGDSLQSWHNFSEFDIARSKLPFSIKYL